ncbi:MAG TPA: hypothetical protein VF658_20925 [Pyrinomonadaceae bacterium]
MRRTLSLLALLVVAAFWTGCSSSTQDSRDGKSTGTYKSSPSDSSPVISNPSNTNTSSSNQPTGTPATGGSKPTGIKPPMKDDKK